MPLPVHTLRTCCFPKELIFEADADLDPDGLLLRSSAEAGPRLQPDDGTLANLDEGGGEEDWSEGSDTGDEQQVRPRLSPPPDKVYVRKKY